MTIGGRGASRRESWRPDLAPISFGPDDCTDLIAATRREWLVTNGLGGFASGTVAGLLTRRYHALLAAALSPPVGRRILVAGLIEWVTLGGRQIALHNHEFADGTIDQRGYERLVSFGLDGMLPVWQFALDDAVLEKRVWMADAENTTFVRWTVVRSSRPIRLQVTPLVTDRELNSLSPHAGWAAAVQVADSTVRVTGASDGRVTHLFGPGADVTSVGTWYRNFRQREEEARGLDSLSDLFAPAEFSVQLQAGDSWTLVLSTEGHPRFADATTALAAARRRQDALLAAADATNAGALRRQLVLAADQFLVRRDPPPIEAPSESTPPATAPQPGRTVIAGYPWFADWGRDTMIALGGLTLATGRFAEGAQILRSFAPFVEDGLIPNNFTNDPSEPPAYNTADASLWYVMAVRAWTDETGDRSLAAALLPTLSAIIEAHLAGTRFGIRVDPADGLLRAGAPGLQLTWMDAKVGDWVVTPRMGKPIEINALWYNALRAVAGWQGERNAAAADRFDAAADRALAAFRARYWQPDRGYLADVVDGPTGDDWSLRPNQIIALSLPEPLVDDAVTRRALEAVGQSLLAPLGLRSLAPTDPAYRGQCAGDQTARDGTYHQGTVWAWLIGRYAEALARVTGDRTAGLDLLRPFEAHLGDAGLGTISEIFDGDPPHDPRGAIAQAWSVAEVLRVWRKLGGE